MRIICLILLTSFIFRAGKTTARQSEIKWPGGSDSIVKSIKSKSNIFIHQYSHASLGTGDHIILYLQKDAWQIVVYQTKDYTIPGTTGVFNYRQWDIKKAYADSVLDIFNKSKFLSISKKNDGCEEKELQRDSSNQLIACRHEHSYHYSIDFMKNKETETKTYYDVFFANTCCPGNNDREVFITCFNALNNIANNFIKKY